MSLPNDAAAILILHNPRCSKSRAAVALLEERGVAFEVRRYLDEPLTRKELGELAKRLGRPVPEWTRQKEQAFADAGLSKDAPEKAWLDGIAAHPILLERPIVVRGDRAVVGRPTDSLLELLDD